MNDDTQQSMGNSRAEEESVESITQDDSTTKTNQLNTRRFAITIDDTMKIPMQPTPLYFHVLFICLVIINSLFSF